MEKFRAGVGVADYIPRVLHLGRGVFRVPAAIDVESGAISQEKTVSPSSRKVREPLHGHGQDTVADPGIAPVRIARGDARNAILGLDA
jgi:hypothetical protein